MRLKATSSSTRATLEILGAPGASIRVDDLEARTEAPLPIYEGHIPSCGLLRLRVPRWAIRVVADSGRRIDVHIDDQGVYHRVDLRRYA